MAYYNTIPNNILSRPENIACRNSTEVQRRHGVVYYNIIVVYARAWVVYTQLLLLLLLLLLR